MQQKGLDGEGLDQCCLFGIFSYFFISFSVFFVVSFC